MTLFNNMSNGLFQYNKNYFAKTNFAKASLMPSLSLEAVI